jgi:hypothetical protein
MFSGHDISTSSSLRSFLQLNRKISPCTGLYHSEWSKDKGWYLMLWKDSRSREYISWTCAADTPMSQRSWLKIACVSKETAARLAGQIQALTRRCTSRAIHRCLLCDSQQGFACPRETFTSRLPRQRWIIHDCLLANNPIRLYFPRWKPVFFHSGRFRPP